MSESQTKKVNKRQYWQDQIKKWQESNISQSEFCIQAGIKLSTFVYWRGLLLEAANKNINKFAPIKIVKDKATGGVNAKVKIKLLTGHVVYLPTEIGLPDIAKLIYSLGLPHA